MDSKENKLYYFIQLELLRLKNLTKEKSNLQGIKDYFQRTYSSMASSRSKAGAVNKLLYCSRK